MVTSETTLIKQQCSYANDWTTGMPRVQMYATFGEGEGEEGSMGVSGRTGIPNTAVLAHMHTFKW